MKIPSKPIPNREWQNKFNENLKIVIVWLIALLIIPVWSFTDASLLSLGGIGYQIFGIYLLYIDEKYKMKSDSRVFGKTNSTVRTILKAPDRLLQAYKNLKKHNNNDQDRGKNSRFSAEVQVTHIDQDYDEIENPEERKEAQMNVIESDLRVLKNFSVLKQCGYIILAFGFIMEFIYTLIG